MDGSTLTPAQLSILVEAIAKPRRMQFGRSSARITRQIEQLELQPEEQETGEAEISPESR